MFSEYITIKTHSHLIGKRARFKHNLQNYSRFLWGAEGTIKQLFQCREGDLNHVGLSLVFDKPLKQGNDYLLMDSCFIAPHSFEILK